MKHIIAQTHTKDTLLYAISIGLERSVFYAIRGVIVLYMLSEAIHMEQENAFELYGWFVGSFTFSQVLGAILGDLIIGNRKALFLGGLMQALGAFCFCIPTVFGLYIGLFLVVVGGGLFVPNIKSNFGKLYLSKPKLMDAGFTMLFVAINIGAFGGVVLMDYFRSEYGWNASFIFSGIMMLLALTPLYFLEAVADDATVKSKATIKQRIFYISMAILVVGLFWAFYEIANFRFFDVKLKLNEIPDLTISEMVWAYLEVVFILPISILAVVLWSLFYSSQFFKLVIGFIFGMISFTILFLIPETPTAQHMLLFVVSILCLGVSEIHIGPIIQSLITRYANPKYLAILISLSLIPMRLFSFIIGFYGETFTENSLIAIKIALIGMFSLSVGVTLFLFWNKKYL